jgi:tetratricopeptide (TPR) repeat protein
LFFIKNFENKEREVRVGDHSATVQIKVLGPFRVIRPGGEDCTPKSRKTCALLALLALSQGKRRTRVWLQDRLWGTRGREQGAASLRQSLVEIRRAFGTDRECLFSDNTLVGLATGLVQVDLDVLPDSGLARGSLNVELLEGMDIGYEDFEDWLREQRQLLAERILAAAHLAEPLEPAPPDAGNNRFNAGNLIVFSNTDLTANPHFLGLADELLDNVGKTVRELGSAQIVDQRIGDGAMTEHLRGSGDRPVLWLRSRILGDHIPGNTAIANQPPGDQNSARIRLTLIAQPGNEMVWSSVLHVDGQSRSKAGEVRLLRHVNEAACVAIEQLSRRHATGNGASEAAAICNAGIRHLFKLGKENFARADTLFAEAFDMEPRGVYLAWRAYLRTFLHAEQRDVCRKSIDEEAFAYLRQAVEIEPNNSYVAALGAHVYSLIRRSYVSAYELAERSIEINPSNPIGWACLGIAKCYLGNSNEGFQDTLVARSIAGYAPCRYQLDALSCIAGAMAGRLDEAIQLGEASHALAPNFASPLRYLTALYFHQGETDRSFEISEKLRVIEPDFSYRKLKERDYPAAGLRKTHILESLPSG